MKEQNNENLLNSYMDFINSLVDKYVASHKSLNHDDLIQSGVLGLFEAHKRYETSFAQSLQTYLQERIKFFLKKEVEKQLVETKHDPIEELKRSVKNGGIERADETDDFKISEIFDICGPILTEKEKFVLSMRYYSLGGEATKNLTEVGEEMGLSRSSVEEIEKEAFRKIRAKLNELRKDVKK